MPRDSPLLASPTDPPAVLSAYLPPATALGSPPFQMVMALDRAGVLQPTRLFLTGEFLDSRAAFVKFSSVGTQKYFFWLNNFCPGSTSQPLLFLIVEETPVSGSAPPSCATQGACLSTQDEDDQNLSSAQRAVPGILLRTTRQLHTEYFTDCC